MNLSATTAIITMVRSAEFPAVWSSLGTVEGQLNANTHQFLLLNDFRDENLEHELRERQFTHLLAPGENLGVARGRNQLLDAALAWGAEFIVSLDDDLIVPADFVIRVTSWLRERLATGQKIGIVIPTVLDFAPVAERIWDSAWIDTVKAGRLRDADPTDAIRRRISGAWPADLPPDLIYHAGIRDWRRHYIDSYQGMARTVHDLYLNSRGRQHQIDETTELRLDPSVRRAAVDGSSAPFPIDTAPGGACAFPAALVQTVGGLDEAFSPFGYEDSDFALRAGAAGFDNYLVPSELLLHDIEGRRGSRSVAVLLQSQGRARALLARKHIEPPDRLRVLAEVGFLAPLQSMALSDIYGDGFGSMAGKALGSATAYLAGFVEGLLTRPQVPSLGSDLEEPDPTPTSLHKRTRFSHQFWNGSPRAGLPHFLPLDVEIAGAWHPTGARFVLDKLVIDSPGAFRVALRGELGNVAARATMQAIPTRLPASYGFWQ